jgi:hypothetical protein
MAGRESGALAGGGGFAPRGGEAGANAPGAAEQLFVQRCARARVCAARGAASARAARAGASACRLARRYAPRGVTRGGVRPPKTCTHELTRNARAPRCAAGGGRVTRRAAGARSRRTRRATSARCVVARAARRAQRRAQLRRSRPGGLACRLRVAQRARACETAPAAPHSAGRRRPPCARDGRGRRRAARAPPAATHGLPPPFPCVGPAAWKTAFPANA